MEAHLGIFVPVAEAPELPANKIFRISTGEECLLSFLCFSQRSYTEDKAMRAIWKVLHKLQSNQPVLLSS